MEDTAKYLIHADFLADGVVERSDVVGAVFGQTEGLLGDDLDIRELQQSSKLGRIDVEVRHESGQSVGEITIASSLDRVETATLAAALEAIERIGPSHAAVEVSRIEDVRAAKRRAVVDRAKELLATAFDEGVMDSDAILEEVRESIRVADITEYAGYPAGPNVGTSDAIIVVEGRSDVLTLLKYGVKNAIAVEGTNVPEAVADLTDGKTVTAFLDGDRGGDLIRRELEQVGDLDYVAIAPDGKSVEDLTRAEVDAALRNKVPASRFEEATSSAAVTDGSTASAPIPADGDAAGTASESASESVPEETVDRATSGQGTADAEPSDATDQPGPSDTTEQSGPSDRSDESGPSDATAESGPSDATAESGTDAAAATEPTGAGQPTVATTLSDHVRSAVESNRALLLDETLSVIDDVQADDAFSTLRDATVVPSILVLDGDVTQRLVDVASQLGVDQVIGTGRGSFVKQPTSVRVRTVDDIR
jgi:DNA primase